MSTEPSNGEVVRNERTMPKRRSRRRAGRDTNAPVQPANCFTLFMMERRPQVVEQYPDMHHIEVSRRIGEEWKTLSAELKEVYLNKASADRRQYLKEMSDYKKTDSYRLFRKEVKKKINARFSDQNTDRTDSDIPIFSKEFLELNRKREAELRRLRGEVVRLEDEQKALHSNLDRLRTATEQLETEAVQQRELTEKIRSQLSIYRRTLVQAFAHMPFPGTTVVPTMSSIDTYMNDIHKLVLEAPGEHQDFLAKVRDIVTQLKMPSAPV